MAAKNYAGGGQDHLQAQPGAQAENKADVKDYLKGLPKWLSEGILAWKIGRASSQFILWFNINDFVLPASSDEPILPVRAYLHKFLKERLKVTATFYYSRATGIMVDYDQGEVTFAGLGDGILGGLVPTIDSPGEKLLSEHKTKVDQRFNRTRSGQHDSPSSPLLVLESILRDPQQRSAVIIDYLEKIAPHGAGEGHGLPEELTALEILQRWALDYRIRTTDNLVIMLTSNLGRVAAPLYAGGSGCIPIMLELPEEDQRESFLRRLHKPTDEDKKRGVLPLPLLADDLLEKDQRGRSTTDDLKLKRLAKLTQGLSFVDIDNLSRTIHARAKIAELRGSSTTPKLTLEDVRKAKEEVIKAQTQGLLEVVTPQSDFNDVGGLEKVKTYMREQASLLKDRSPHSIRGIVLVGPPGTGKSIIAEALATESGLNMVKMRDIRSKWVGESEQNLTKVLNLIVALAPVVVFVDEIDQAMGQRETGFSGDTGVGARMFGRILEFMGSNEYRGKVVWVGASNRPDLLDEAMVRRFDRVVPFLVPDEAERKKIFEVMPRQIIRGAMRGQEKPEAFYAKGVELAEMAHETLGLTGAAIEMIVRRAQELAKGSPVTIEHLRQARKDFKPNHNKDMYDFQSMVALQYTNFYSIMPSIPEQPPFNASPYKDFITAYGDNPMLDSDQLLQKIAEYRQRLAMARLI